MPRGRRIACLFVPLFPLAARLRSEPDLHEVPLAIFQGNGHAARLVAASRRARRAGLKRAMTLSQARALLPDLTLRSRDFESERTAQKCLLEVAESHSPRVEDSGPGVVFLDLLAGSDETAFAHSLATDSEKAGLPAWVGLASSRLAARVAAEQRDSPTIVPVGDEAEFLAPLPPARLLPGATLLQTLDRWGIHSIRAFASLPASEVASRLGPQAQELHEQARGLDRRPLVPYQPPATFDEGLDLDWPLVSLEPFLFVARAAIERLCRRLESRGLACACLQCSLRLEPDGFDDRSILLPAPTRDVKTLLTLIHLDLEKKTPGAPVIGFTFSARPDRPREAQLTLFGPAALSPDKLATGLARLFSILGPDRVGAPRVADTHLPEDFRLLDYSPPAPPTNSLDPPSGKGLLAVRVLRPPAPLEVLCSRPPERPLSIRSIHIEKDKALHIQGKVKIASGPWTVEQSWWSSKPAQRDYWDVELSDGGIYRIYRRATTGDWFADGVYD
ncbi:MAG: DNA polymerase Y family protein [Acidobacteriota bacterium]|nr:DNA polymerase Y family protein [Acidobacteriota bacterium]